MSADELKSKTQLATGKSFNLLEELSMSASTDVGKKKFRHLINECGMDLRCHCVKSVLDTESPESDVHHSDIESSDSLSSLDRRLTTVQDPLSMTERRLPKVQPLKLFKNKVDRTWHKRYNCVLPEDQQFDLQPYDEIQHRDEEIALEYFYGNILPPWLTDGSKEAADIRSRILSRYNREKRREEEAQAVTLPDVFIHTRVESIISVNRTRAAQTAWLFGPSAAERAKLIPVIEFMNKLCRLRARQRERALHPIAIKSKWHKVHEEATMRAIKRMLEAEKKIQARLKFRRTIKVVRAVVRFIRVISIMSRDARHVLTEIHYFQEHQRMQTQLKIANKASSAATTILASRDVFDPNKYRFSSRFKVSNEIRMILTKPWNLRSDQEVAQVVERLQELRCFVEYPVSFQHKLARLAWLIEVAADLAIIREGHFAADFYFMLAGKAQMIKLHGSPCLAQRGTFHVLRTLRNGDAFGDESMSHPDSERTYSVITTEKSILLSLSSVDYVSMLQNTRYDEQAPEHIIFLSTLAFLRDFPKQKLIEEGDEYIRNYYLRAGSVISEALSESEYIYVVKYGSCRVLVEMPPQGAAWTRKRRSTVEVIRMPSQFDYDRRSAESRPSVHHQKQGGSRVSSVLEFLQGHKDDIAKSPTAIAALKHMKQAHVDKEYQITKAEAEVFKKRSLRMYHSLKPRTIMNASESSLREQESQESYYKPMRANRVSVVDNSTATGTSEEAPVSHAESASRSSRGSLDFDSNLEESDDLRQSLSSRQNVEKHLSFIITGSENSKAIKNVKSSSSARHAVGTTIEMDIDLERLQRPSASIEQEEVEDRRHQGSIPAGAKRRMSSRVKLPEIVSASHVRREPERPAHKCSRWKLMKTMVKGDYIGHEWVDLNRGPFEPPDEEMSLVSDGCEVIMMNRAFLIKYLRNEL